ncbi:MAG TPA: FHA domain-containing protein [Ilumatobacteraceae bacterium]|nr:FHA domain-containing protein [Ilumatobacteraceae bacterium]
MLIEDRRGVRINLTGAVDPALFVALHEAFTSAPTTAGFNPAPLPGSAMAPPAAPMASAPLPAAAPPPGFAQPGFPHPGSVQSGFTHPGSAPPSGGDRTMTVAELRSMRSGAIPAVQLPDGRRMLIGSGLVFGRQPGPNPDLPAATLVPISDPSLSKTHASFGPTPTGVWVCDHQSTNGSTVEVGSSAAVCAPGARVEVPIGATVVLGEIRIPIVEWTQ